MRRIFSSIMRNLQLARGFFFSSQLITDERLKVGEKWMQTPRLRNILDTSDASLCSSLFIFQKHCNNRWHPAACRCDFGWYWARFVSLYETIRGLRWQKPQRELHTIVLIIVLAGIFSVHNMRIGCSCDACGREVSLQKKMHREEKKCIKILEECTEAEAGVLFSLQTEGSQSEKSVSDPVWI